jgi:8-oxo-dGTP pyrophosphatase MutT (NUDIX family)
MGRPERMFLEGVLVEAAGGLLWRAARDGPKLAVIHRPRRQDWSLPKGKLKPGESFPAAALREVAEETGCHPRLGDFAGYATYIAKRRPKLVLFWHMAAVGAGRFQPNDEVDRVEWLSLDDALRRLDHPAERRLVRSVRPMAVAQARRGRLIAA